MSRCYAVALATWRLNHGTARGLPGETGLVVLIVDHFGQILKLVVRPKMLRPPFHLGAQALNSYKAIISRRFSITLPLIRARPDAPARQAPNPNRELLTATESGSEQAKASVME